MKAIVCTKYGPPEILQVKEVAAPVPKENEALIQVFASSINAADLEALKGAFVTRVTAPFKPALKIPGTDISGKIKETGTKIKQFKPGDEIWGDLSFPLKGGAFAEYVCVPEQALRLKPASMSFEEAAAIPTGGVVALQHLVAKRPIKPGQKVLINGAGGSVGTFAVQIAKHFGAEVTGVDSKEKLEMLRSIGADYVINFRQEDFTRNGKQYDLILDVVVRRWISSYKRALTNDGVAIMVGGSLLKVFINVFLGLLPDGKKKIGLGVWKPNKKEDLDILKELFESGKIKPVIDKRYPLDGVPEGFHYLEEGRAKGKLIITVKQNNKI
jgi:NADPH:quinone reductase-like Zn-dependent oxidoreductase